MKTQLIFAALLLGSLAVYALSQAVPVSSRAHAAEPKADAAVPQAVEGDMHEFMEYVFQPTYKRLKQSMAAAPADNTGWKGIKSDSLILAEGGNLLLFRGPAETPAAWAETSTAVRDLGGKLYQAAKKKDFESASQHYRAMLTQCNRCHTEFANGEHQLTP
ncbi:hypothetical protein [Lignipirellula cremea]|uniref:Cytochrome c n=1 Tax=Lignipirellula cremea TaxID=2528010 RepID=A0A518DTT6_9BACT|nr:hypothetical protein [Lignipirellula cremea]QDU95244.1 hypothetical protein Pla8534_30590 [Lignipirellula cremea]